MSRLTHIFLLTFVLLFLQENAFAAKARERKMSEYILDGRQFHRLGLDQKISYIKFLLVYIATIEDMQSVVSKQKTAHLDSIRQFVAIFLEEAHADSYIKAGATCIHSMTLSQYVESNGKLYCSRPKALDNSTCRKGQSPCPGLSTLIADASSICIVPPRVGERPGHSAKCVDQAAKVLGVDLNKKIIAQINAFENDPKRQEEMRQLSTKMEAGIKSFEEQSNPNGLSIAQYCENSNSANRGLQREECAALKKLQNVFDASVTGNRPGFDAGFTPTPAASANPAPASPVAAAQFTTANENPDCTSTDRAVRIAAFDSGKCEFDMNSVSEPIPPKWTSDEMVRDPSKLFKPGNQPTPPNVPAPISPTAIIKSDECLSRYQAQLGSLACIACGLESVREADIRTNGQGVSNWISLVGAMAQTYHGPYNVNDPTSRTQYQTQVMDMIATYGYCTNKEYPAASGFHSNQRAWVDGTTRLSPKMSGGNADVQFNNIYGIASGNHPDTRMTYPKEIFGDNGFFESGSDFEYNKSSTPKRQWHFRSMISGHAAAYPNAAFSKCAGAIENRINKDSAFNMCAPSVTKSANGSIASVTTAEKSESDWTANHNVYRAMQTACGITNVRRIAAACDKTCYQTRNTSGGYAGCVTDPYHPGDESQGNDNDRGYGNQPHGRK